MKKTKLLRTLLIPTLGISTIGFVTTVATSCGEQPKPSTFSVTGGSSTLWGVINKSGSDEKTWVLKKDGEVITEGVTWAIDRSVSGVSIADGKVSWANELSNGTYNFKVVAVYNTKTYKSEDITLSIKKYEVLGSGKKIQIIPSYSNYDKDNKWILTEAVSGEVITEDVIWSLVPAEGSSVPGWVRLNKNNEISWTNAVRGTYTFYIRATYDGEIFTSVRPITLEVDGAANDSLEITPDKDGTFALLNTGENSPDLQYSFDENNWNVYSTQINISKGQTLYLKGNNPTGWSHSAISYSQFRITGDISVTGNIMALLDNGARDGDSGNITDIPNNYCFMKLFSNCSELKMVDYYVLSATTLKEYCYYQMFEGCTLLTRLPGLLAKNLDEYCYCNMFKGCTSLVNAPELPVTTLAEACYNGMFTECSNLTTAPELPAKTLAIDCYKEMFSQCTKLSKAPALPATELADDCYSSMFEGCTSLPYAPELPSPYLKEGCYLNMFRDCSSIQKPPRMYPLYMSKDCCKYMFKGCTSLETTPAIDADDLAEACYYGMFEGCTSLVYGWASGHALAPSCFENMFYGCSKLTTVAIEYNGKYESSYFNNWVFGVAEVGNFYRNGYGTAQDFGFPVGWLVVPFAE